MHKEEVEQGGHKPRSPTDCWQPRGARRGEEGFSSTDFQSGVLLTPSRRRLCPLLQTG